MPAWLRWILVLPAALGAYFGIQLLVGLMSELIEIPWFFPADWTDPSQDWWAQGLNSVLGPIALIYAGSFTAPEGYRFYASLALAVVFGVITGGVLAIGLYSTELSHPLWWLFLTSIASVITVIVCCFKIHRFESDKAL